MSAGRFNQRPNMQILKRVNKLFLCVVVAPTLVAGIYFGAIASDVYVSESMFVVRSPQQQTASPLGLMLESAGFSRAPDDAYVVQNYLLSRDALASLDEKQHAIKAYSRESIDVFSRFHGLDWDESFEAFYRYFQKHLDLQLDSLSSITTLTIRAYSSEDAYRINERLLELAETRVNQLNQRGQQDTIRFASQQVGEAEKKVSAASLALAGYRNEKEVIDPEQQSAIPLQQIAKLQDELIAAKIQLAQLLAVANDNPKVPVLKQQVNLLEKEIATETQRVAGGGGHSLASKAPEYQRLALEKVFADKMLASAMTTLEQARSEAQRQQLYLERVAQPSKPDAATEPHRARGILATFLLGLILWGVLSLTVAAVKEHVD